MYQTPRRMWRNVCEIPNYGWVVWEILESRYEYDKDDDYDTSDRDGYSVFVTPHHYWTREEAMTHYLRAPKSERFDLILVGRLSD
jgi:hypothetical protein